MDADKKIWLRKLLIGIIIGFIIGLIAMAQTADAAPVETEDPPGIFNSEYTKLPDDSQAHYYIDLSTKEEEDGGLMDAITDLNPSALFDEKSKTFTNFVVNMGLTWNMMMTNLMIGILNFGFQTEIVNALADSMTGMVQQMAGLTGGGVNGGLYGALIGFAVLSTGVAVVWQLFVKRAPLASLRVVFQTVVSIGLALALFANFGPVIKGMNEISTQISASMLTGGTNAVSGETRTPEQLREEVSANLWDSFIGRPYMIMQYGTDDIEEIGTDRVNELLAMPEGEDRQSFVNDTEVGDRGNANMTPANVEERAAFTLVYSGVNLVVSIPIFILALALLVFKVWFLLMAFLAPFFLVQSAFPGQFGVLKKYAIELTYPLVCQVIATVATFFMFSFGFIIYSLPPFPGAVGIPSYFVAAAFNLVIFATIFLLRKRISKIMGAGNAGPFDSLRHEIGGLKQSMDTAADKIGTLGKAAIGVAAAASTGGTSAAIGAAVGHTVKAKEHAAPSDEPTHHQTNTEPIATIQETAPQKVDTATHSEPVATITETQNEPASAPQAEPQPVTKDEPPATIQESAPAAKASEPEPEPQEDLTQPLASINELDDAGDVSIQRDQETMEEGEKHV